MGLKEKLVKKINDPEKRFQRELRASNSYSLTVLNSFFRLKTYIPLTPWSISPTGICQILNYISIYRPKVVIELGSGISTVYIAKLIEQNKLDTVFHSVDHDAGWIDIVKGWLANEGLNDRVRFVHAPLVKEQKYGEHSILWYDTRVLESSLPVNDLEFLIIDAPPGDFPYSRAGAFLFFQRQIQNAQMNYFMDDANRKEETEIANALGNNNLYLLDYVLGGRKQLLYDSTPISLFK